MGIVLWVLGAGISFVVVPDRRAGRREGDGPRDMPTLRWQRRLHPTPRQRWRRPNGSGIHAQSRIVAAKLPMTDQLRSLGDDTPKSNPWQEDRLGFAPFAKGIARVLTERRFPSGYVVGVHGRWGTGKSTMLNFVLANVDKYNQENENRRIEHIAFRPWMISGHHDLIAGFFKVLSETLLPPGRMKAAKRWVSAASNATDGIVDAAATMALVIDPTAGVASGAVREVAKKGIRSAIDRFLEEPSLQAAYEKLKSSLKDSDKRILVTIDDIDRLDPSEVREIMQMVKSVGQLPNVVYLLAYDRELVWKALDGDPQAARPRFTEKIVQQEIEIPNPSKNTLLGILDRELSFIAAADETARWHYLVRDGVRRWINSPRDVTRLANAASFTWSAMEGELDPLDLLAMEGLRLFDAGAFAWIRDNRDFLFSEGRFLLAEDEDRKQAVTFLERRIPDDSRRQVLRLLSVLFPQSTKWFEGREGSGVEIHSEVVKRRGVGSDDGYDTYFGLHPSTDAIPKAVIDEIVSGGRDVDWIERTIRGYLGKRNSRRESMINKLFEGVRARFLSRQAPEPSQQLLDALFRVGDGVIGLERGEDIFDLSPRAQIGFLVRAMLDRWDKQADSHMVAAFAASSSIGFLADVYVARGRELAVFPGGDPEFPVISMEAFVEIGALLLPKIREASNSGALSTPPYYFDIVRAWSYLDNPTAPRSWLNQGMSADTDFLVKVARGLVSYTFGGHRREYNLRQAPESDVYDLGVIVESSNRALAGGGLSEDEQTLLTEIASQGKEYLAESTSR